MPLAVASGVRSWLQSVWEPLCRCGLVELAARVGYASRGVVYASVGVMALLKVAGLTPHAEGAARALEAWSTWRIGVLLLWVVGVGLCGFAFWRALQSVVDIERLGVSAMALATRAGKAVSGLLYGTLGVTTLRLLDTLRDLRKGDDDADAAASVQHVLTLPFGRTLVIGFGVLLLAVGLGNMLRAFIDHFTRSLASTPAWDGVIGVLARVGYFARGVAFLPAASFIIVAGWQSRPHQVVSLGHSLDLWLSLPYGGAILAIQGLGLAAFGVFGLTKALWRRVAIEPSNPL